MRKLSLVLVLVSFLLLSLASMVRAEETTFPWKVLRGSPRSATPIQTAEQAKAFLLGPAKGDLSLVTTKEDATKTVVLLEQNGAKALRTIRVKPGNMVSEDNGTTWQVGEFRNIVFGTDTPVVFKGPLSIEWGNYPGGVAYYPADLDSEWVPVVQGACGNAYLWHRPRKTTTPPTVTGQVVQPTPTPTPTPLVALGPPPDNSGRVYVRPERVAEARSVHQVGMVGQIPIPKQQEIKISNSGNNRNIANSSSTANNAGNTNTNINDNTNINNNINQQIQNNLQQLINNIQNNNTNINENVNALNAIMQQLQQLVVPIAINNN